MSQNPVLLELSLLWCPKAEGGLQETVVHNFYPLCASVAPRTLPCSPPVPGPSAGVVGTRETVGGGAEGWGVREADRRRGLWGAEDYKRAVAEGRGIHPA